MLKNIITSQFKINDNACISVVHWALMYYPEFITDIYQNLILYKR